MADFVIRIPRVSVAISDVVGSGALYFALAGNNNHVLNGQDISSAMNDLAVELKARGANETPANEAPATFLFIHGLHKFKKLRHDFFFRTFY